MKTGSIAHGKKVLRTCTLSSKCCGAGGCVVAFRPLGRGMAKGFLLLLIAAFFFSPPARSGVLKDSVDPCASQNSAEQTKTAEALLEAGNASFESGDLRQAEDAWMKARNCPRTVAAWPKAVFNLGVLKARQADYSQAIEYFKEVLQSHPNDKEPGGDLMQAYRNYSHRSAMQISACYEKMGDYRKALRYAWLAQRRYPYLSWCGTCLDETNSALKRRIAYLTARSFGIQLLAIVVLAGVTFRWKKMKSA